MSNILQSDIFFLISSISTIILAIILSIIGYYIILIVRDAKYITGKLRDATLEFEEKFQSVKEQIGEKSQNAKYIVDFFLSRFMGKKKSRSRSKKNEDLD